MLNVFYYILKDLEYWKFKSKMSKEHHLGRACLKVSLYGFCSNLKAITDASDRIISAVMYNWTDLFLAQIQCIWNHAQVSIGFVFYTFGWGCFWSVEIANWKRCGRQWLKQLINEVMGYEVECSRMVFEEGKEKIRRIFNCKLSRISETARECLLIIALVPDCFSGGMTIF